MNPIDFFKTLFKIKKTNLSGKEVVNITYLHPNGAVNNGEYCTTADLIGTKKYRALLTQSGTTAPSATILMNTIDPTSPPVWSYSTVGVYLLTYANGFTSGKTIPYNESFLDVDGNKYKMEWVNVNTMKLTTYLATDTETPANGVLTSQYVNIEIVI